MIAEHYGNYAILILIRKNNIDFSNFVKQVYNLKQYLRQNTKVDYFSYVFDFKKIFESSENQRLVILDEANNEKKKNKMNENGEFYIFDINSLHSPDASIERTIFELEKLCSMKIICSRNRISDDLIRLILKYKSFEYLQDLEL